LRKWLIIQQKWTGIQVKERESGLSEGEDTASGERRKEA
jgi:hypothetical protein